MNARCLLSFGLTVIWFLPIALAGGVGLHQAFDHDHEQSRDGLTHIEVLAEVLEHGHAHAGEGTDHKHVLVTAPPVAIRVGAASAPLCESVPGIGAELGRPGELPGWIASHSARPPRASGASLLALIAIFRI